MSWKMNLLEKTLVSVGVFVSFFLCIYVYQIYDNYSSWEEIRFDIILPVFAYVYIFGKANLFLLFLLFYLFSKRAVLSAIVAGVIYVPIAFLRRKERMNDINLSLRSEGVDLYVNGDMTPEGMLWELQGYLFDFTSIILVAFLVSRIVKRMIHAD